MKFIRALLGALAQGMNGPAFHGLPKSGANFDGKSPPAHRGSSMLGTFLTETVSYHH